MSKNILVAVAIGVVGFLGWSLWERSHSYDKQIRENHGAF